MAGRRGRDIGAFENPVSRVLREGTVIGLEQKSYTKAAWRLKTGAGFRLRTLVAIALQ